MSGNTGFNVTYGVSTANGVIVGNTSTNLVINSTAITFANAVTTYTLTGATIPNINVAALSANSAAYLGTQPASAYQLNSGMAANVATLTANNTGYVYQTPSPAVVNTSMLSGNLTNYQLLSGMSSYLLTAAVSGLSVNNSAYLGGVISGGYVTNNYSGNVAISGILNVGGCLLGYNVLSGYYWDGNSLAARYPGSSGGFYVQSAAGGATYMTSGAVVGGTTFPTGNVSITNNLTIGGNLNGIPVSPGPVLLNTPALSGGVFTDTTSFTSTYRYYDIYLENVLPATTGQLYVRFYVGGSFQGSGYQSYVTWWNAGGQAASAPTMYIPLTSSAVSPTSGQGVCGMLRLYNPSSSTTCKTIDGNLSDVTSYGYFERCLGGGAYTASTSPVTGIQISFVSVSAVAGTVRIYGQV